MSTERIVLLVLEIIPGEEKPLFESCVWLTLLYRKQRRNEAILQIASNSWFLRFVYSAPDWTYTISHNAMLQSSRAFILWKDYRSRESSQHTTAVQFIKETLRKEFSDSVDQFDQLRWKRNRTVYETAMLFNAKGAERALVVAQEFVILITDIISQQEG